MMSPCVHVQQAGDGPQGRGLAGPVGAQQRDYLSVTHLNGDAAQYQDHIVVDHFQVADFKHFWARLPNDYRTTPTVDVLR